MSSSTESPVRSVVNAIDSNPESPKVVGHLLHQGEGGMFDNFEVVIPSPEERAHLPPRDFHTFYINQLEMGLRFPLPSFIAVLCQHIKISPSQLAPNSYSFLLALGVLFRYHNLPLVPYVLMQLVQVKRLGPGKFYLSYKEDHAFIKGNPSSHKGWMSRFFFVKRVGKKRDSWKCEMYWRDKMYTLTPRTPDRSPNLASFLDAMRDNSYNAPELIQEYLLYFFGFSRRGVDLVGDLGIAVPCLSRRMGKADMLKLVEEEEAAVASSKKATKKRRASTPSEKEARREKKKKKEASTSGARLERIPEEGRSTTPPKHTAEDRPESPPIITIAGASSPKKKGPGRVPPLDYSEDLLVASPSGSVATRYICHMAPDRDIDLLRGAETQRLVPLVLILTLAPCAGNGLGGEVVRRLTQAHRAVNVTRRSFDEAMDQHAELVAWLEELEALRSQEQRAAEARKEALEAQLAVEKVAQAVEEQSMRSELDVVLAKKTAVEVELEETRGRAEEEAGRLSSEAVHAWDLGKEEVLKSSEFDTLCVRKALKYFKSGFSGCLAQFQDNGYSEKEHPASFLDFKKALADMDDKEEAEEEEEERKRRATLLPRAPLGLSLI
ncbi:hypothetical protein F511_15582 [Dorcoceras hygrometricum]|uniref:Transposase (Putative), gypsy type n=1 Tax=Dorcoceras hygrometricum TaxID=472368 RepID=A0A2Z7B2H4_9LAMI|nr:hypothetical protein F511_15582 [Dorcoceras hygrometricum]